MSEVQLENDLPQERTSSRERREKHSLNAMDRQYAAQPDVPKRIHILGTGSIGKLVAHSLRGIPNPPPVTLIFHRYKLLKSWEHGMQEITLEDDGYRTTQGGFDVELAREMRRQHGVELESGASDVYSLSNDMGVRPHEAARIMEDRKKESSRGAEQTPDGAQVANFGDRLQLPGDYAVNDEPIHNLIVTTKAIRTVAALAPIRHRLSRSSTICFLQNGMGILDDVNEHVFPHEADRPNYVQGIVTHGANVPPEKAAQDPFYVVHAGHGTIALGLLPRENQSSDVVTPPSPSGPGPEIEGKLKEGQEDQWAPNARYLLRTLTRCPALCAVGFTPIELFQQQLEKLAINSILNPLTVLLDNRNGHILYNFALSRTMRLMLAETSLVIRSLPELKGIANVPFRFSAERLETVVVGVANKTKDNISSMLADVRAGRKTEIEYINGYIVKRGEEIGIKSVVNYAIMQTVIGKCLMVQREVADSVPVENSEQARLNRE